MREGGVSEGSFESLNLGFSVGDEPARVQENLRRLAHSGGMEPYQLHTVSQVHGDAVHRVMPPLRAARAELLPPEATADAVWTSARGHGVGVKTADCVPILLVDPIEQRVAAVHSGWKGTELRIAARMVEAWVREGSDAGSLLAVIGPCIRACCYEVSEALSARFEKTFGAAVSKRQGEKKHLNLPWAVRQTLLDVGMKEDRLDDLAACTACDSERFFSHRRTRGHTGRHLSFVVCRF